MSDNGAGEGNTEYLHGAEASEQARLEAQAEMLGGAEFLPPLKPEMHVVEVGCGTGAIARRVARKLGSGEVIGVDRQEAQLETARRLADGDGVENIRFVLGAADALDLPSSSCDAAYGRFILEHVADPVAVVREMARVVKPGGWICVYEWDNAMESIYPDSPHHRAVWAGIYRLQELQGGDPWMARQLRRVFMEAGLANVTAEARVWTVTGGEPDKLRVLVDGAREIIRQSRAGLLERGLVAQEALDGAEGEYDRLLRTAHSYVAEGFCRAVGSVRD